MAKERNINQNTNEIKPDFEQKISVIDFIDTLQLRQDKKNILKMTYQSNKEFHTVSEWQKLIKTS